MNCPHCSQEINVSAVARAQEESKVIFAVTPSAGELFDVMTIGSVLVKFARMLTVAGKQLGTKSIVLLERVECGENGSLNFHCFVCRSADKKPGRKRPSRTA